MEYWLSNSPCIPLTPPRGGGGVICTLRVRRGIRYVFFSSDPYSAFAIYDEVPYYHNGVLIWDETELNITPNNAAHYNTSSGKYCAEFSGTYLFQLHLYKSSSTSGTAYCYIIKEWLLGYEARLARAYNDGSFEASTATIVNLAQGDCVYVGDCTGPTLITRQTSFSGALLHLLD